jgi:hypothetical protein
VCVFLELISYAILNSLKLKTEYYSDFFSYALKVNFIIVFLNILGNLDNISNECVLYRIRAFTACLITVFPIVGFIFLFGFFILESLV